MLIGLVDTAVDCYVNKVIEKVSKLEKGGSFIWREVLAGINWTECCESQ